MADLIEINKKRQIKSQVNFTSAKGFHLLFRHRWSSQKNNTSINPMIIPRLCRGEPMLITTDQCSASNQVGTLNKKA